MDNRIRIRMLQNHDALFQGEHLNLPSALADELVRSGKAEAVTGPRQQKPAGPSETKPAGPAETKRKGKK